MSGAAAPEVLIRAVFSWQFTARCERPSQSSLAGGERSFMAADASTESPTLRTPGIQRVACSRPGRGVCPGESRLRRNKMEARR